MEITQATVVEIGPRDGFQNVGEFIPTEIKKRIIDGLVKARFKKIQVTSFVNPKAIPQMQDAEDIARHCVEHYPEVDLFALVPNFRGAQIAWGAGLREVTPVISLSASHNQLNVRKTHQESIDEIARIREAYPELRITQDIATVFGCPFEGPMEIPPLIDLIGKIADLGVTAFTLCDTIGVAYPKQVVAVLKAAKIAFPTFEFNLHIHDTRNMGILNSYVGLLNGADSVQTSLGGLGGCPFAPGATGNTASEDLVYMLERNGWSTGVDFQTLLETAKYTRSVVPGNYSGHHINITVQQHGFS